MKKDYFYMRISTRERNESDKKKDQEQTFERQKGIFKNYGFELTEENTFAERISGKTKNDEREEFEKLLNVLKEGDRVIFTETSRFSRSYINGMQMLDTLIFEKKVNVKFISNGIDLYANSKFNPYTWYTISQMLLADELQRRIISFNTTNGLAKKKADGVLLGRNSGLTEDERNEIRKLAKRGIKQNVLAEKFGVNPSTISRIIRGLLD